jgi:fructose-1,6-bisphosphatase/inositol monophosphatase family enzyme
VVSLVVSNNQGGHFFIDILPPLRYRDVAAGFAILEEAGGLITTANPPEDPATGEITDAKLGGRLYLAIRYWQPPGNARSERPN